jgi:hypothetical protein
MKIAFLLFNLLCTAAWGANATFTAIFDHQPQDPSLEYAIEVKQADGSWKEVVRGPASPLVFTLSSVSYGQTVTVRAYVRMLPTPLPRNPAEDTSNEASATVTPAAPVMVDLRQQKTAKTPTFP